MTSNVRLPARWAAPVLLVAATATGCASGPEPAPDRAFYAPPHQYLTIDEVLTDRPGAYWHRMVALSDFERRETAGRIASSLKPTVFSYTAEGVNPMRTVLIEGVRPLTGTRDPKTETLTLSTGPTALTRLANTAVAATDPAHRLKTGAWTYRAPVVDGDTTRLRPTSKNATTLFRSRHVQGAFEKLFLVTFEGDAGRIDHPPTGTAFSMRYDGYAVLSADGAFLYQLTFRYRGELTPKGRPTLRYAGQQIILLTHYGTGRPVVRPSEAPEFSRLADRFPPLTRDDGQFTGKAAPRPPAWFAPLWTASRQVGLVTAARAEGRANPIPLIAIAAVHAVDGLFTLAANVVHDVGQSVKTGTLECNPFDGDIPSPLGMVYDKAAEGWVQIGVSLGVVDEKNVAFYSKLGGAVAKLPGDIASIFITPGGVRGAHASLQGIARSSARLSVKMSAVSARIVDGCNKAIKTLTRIDPTTFGIGTTVWGAKETAAGLYDMHETITESRPPEVREEPGGVMVVESDFTRATTPETAVQERPDGTTVVQSHFTRSSTPETVVRTFTLPGDGTAPADDPVGAVIDEYLRTRPGHAHSGSHDPAAITPAAPAPPKKIVIHMSSRKGFGISYDGVDATADFRKANPTAYGQLQDALGKSENVNIRSVVEVKDDRLVVQNFKDGKLIHSHSVKLPPQAAAMVHGHGGGPQIPSSAAAAAGPTARQKFRRFLHFVAHSSLVSVAGQLAETDAKASKEVLRAFGDVHDPYDMKNPYEDSDHPDGR
jgi:hypothetical protein